MRTICTGQRYHCQYDECNKQGWTAQSRRTPIQRRKGALAQAPRVAGEVTHSAPCIIRFSLGVIAHNIPPRKIVLAASATNNACMPQL